MSEKTNINSKKWQKIIFIILGGVLGVVLLILGGADRGTPDESADALPQSGIYTDADAYASALEARVSTLCSQVSGAGEVSVFISLRGGYRTVYALDSQSSSSGYKSEVVMSGSGSSEKAIVSAYENPEIAGVGIVCTGGGDAHVRQQLISLVAASLDVSTNKIFIASSS